MKRIFLFIVLFGLAVSASFGQKQKPPPVPTPKPKPVSKAAPKITTKKQAVAPPLTEISTADWSTIVGALDSEDWTRAALLSSAALGKLKNDNDKKQLAQLRYFYLYALAGKAAEGKITYTELEKTANRYVGKEFLMPSRQLLAVCKNNVNYICPVTNDEKALRVTATDKSASAIHSFEYVQLTDKFDVAENEGKLAFLGGKLQKAEINLYKSELHIMRLVFDQGFVNVVSIR